MVRFGCGRVLVVQCFLRTRKPSKTHGMFRMRGSKNGRRQPSRFSMTVSGQKYPMDVYSAPRVTRLGMPAARSELRRSESGRFKVKTPYCLKNGRGELVLSRRPGRCFPLKSLNPYSTADSAAMTTLPDFDVETSNLGALLAFEYRVTPEVFANEKPGSLRGCRPGPDRDHLRVFDFSLR